VKGRRRIADIAGLPETHPVLGRSHVAGVAAIAGLPPFGVFTGELRGKPAAGEGIGLDGAVRHRSMLEPGRVIGPSKPGNAGGGNDSDVWCVFESNEVV
jgi:hypothetical protein